MTQAIVGLGNAEARYDGTRHNIGFDVLDELASRLDLTWKKRSEHYVQAEGHFKQEKLILAKPLTFMNLSGRAVEHLLAYFDLPKENLLVICDDVEIPFGSLRYRLSGSSGGHNGLKSVQAAVGDQDYRRLRVGVGRGAKDLVKHVLGPFSKEEQADLPQFVQIAADAVCETFEENGQHVMSKYNKNVLEEFL